MSFLLVLLAIIALGFKHKLNPFLITYGVPALMAAAVALGAIENGQPKGLAIVFVAISVFIVASIEYLKDKGKL